MLCQPGPSPDLPKLCGELRSPARARAAQHSRTARHTRPALWRLRVRDAGFRPREVPIGDDALRFLPALPAASVPFAAQRAPPGPMWTAVDSRVQAPRPITPSSSPGHPRLLEALGDAGGSPEPRLPPPLERPCGLDALGEHGRPELLASGPLCPSCSLRRQASVTCVTLWACRRNSGLLVWPTVWSFISKDDDRKLVRAGFFYLKK